MKTSLGLKHVEDISELRKELSYITQAGFDTVDLDLSMEGQLKMLHSDNCIERSKKARQVLDEYGLKVYQGHSPYNLHKMDDPEYDRIRHEEVLLSLPAAAELGIEYMIVHPFFCFNLHDPLFLKWDELLEKNIQMYTGYVKRAAELGVKICTENMFAMNDSHTETHRTYFSNADDLNQLMDAVPGLTCCMDTGHALATHFDLGEMARKLGKRITTLHVHNNNHAFDLHLAPFQHYSTDWEGFCKAIKEVGYQGSMNLEVGGFTAVCPEAVMKAAYQYLYATAKTLADMVENA